MFVGFGQWLLVWYKLWISLNFSPIYFSRPNTFSHPGGFKFQNPPEHEETKRETESRQQVSNSYWWALALEYWHHWYHQDQENKQQSVAGGQHSGRQETRFRASRISVCRELGTDHQEGAKPCCDIDIHHDHFLYPPHTEVHLYQYRDTHITSQLHLLFFRVITGFYEAIFIKSSLGCEKNKEYFHPLIFMSLNAVIIFLQV